MLDLRTPEINVKQGDANILSNEDSYDFGGVNINSMSSIIIFTIENIGTADLYLSGDPTISISGDNADMFVVIPPTATAIAAGRNTTFNVIFHPTSLNHKLATVTILNNDSDEGIYSFTILGNTPPVAEFNARLRTGIAPLDVIFTDESGGGITSWEWDFNSDGIIDDYTQNPSYKYSDVGKYSVSLKVTGPGGEHSIVKTSYIEIMSSVKHLVDIDFTEPSLVQIAKIDDDDYNDIICISSSTVFTADFTWWKNNEGNGLSWTETPITGSLGKTQILLVADVNFDNANDIIVGDSSEIIWWQNDGAGNFSTPASPTIDNSNYKVAGACVAYIDSGSYPDLVAISKSSDEVAWWQNASGTFSAKSTIDNTFSDVTSVCAVDIDKDGDTDVIASAEGSNGRISWWENTNGEGTFGATANSIATFFDKASSVCAADLDGDTEIDIVAKGENEIAWWKNDGSENFTKQDSIETYNLTFSMIDLIDVNDDGAVDVIGMSSLEDKAIWWENDGSGNFSKHTIDNNFNGAKSIAAGNINESSNKEFIGISYDENSIVWWDINKDIWSMHSLDTEFHRADCVYGIDIDKDDDIDVIGAAEEDNTIKLWHNYYGDGLSWSETIIDDDFESPRSIQAADINGDGNIDIIGGAYSDFEIAWWENSGNSHDYIKHTVTNTFTCVDEIFAADINGDGNLDIVGTTSVLNLIAWWENLDGMGNFGPMHIINTVLTTYDARGLYCVDLDGDNDIDILSTALQNDDIAWWENDGSGNFINHMIDSSFNYSMSVSAADIDGDGLTDILAASNGDNEIVWWKNNGNKTFTAKLLIDSEFESANFITAFDIDNDGDTDIIATNTPSTTHTIAWWENDGSENFTKKLIRDDLDSTCSLFLSDIDQDGDPDILGTATNDHVIFWLENNLCSYGP